MSSIIVFIKSQGVLAACPAYPQPDGCLWRCAKCDNVIMRAAFGIMNGLFRCSCGSEVELLVNGASIDIEAMSEIEKEVHTDKPAAKSVSDQDFLRECGIATEAISHE